MIYFKSSGKRMFQNLRKLQLKWGKKEKVHVIQGIQFVRQSNEQRYSHLEH